MYRTEKTSVSRMGLHELIIDIELSLHSLVGSLHTTKADKSVPRMIQVFITWIQVLTAYGSQAYESVNNTDGCPARQKSPDCFTLSAKAEDQQCETR